MKETIIHFFGIVLTPWKVIGFMGASMFAARWLVQAMATKQAGKPTIPRSFWIISLMGSGMVTSYFIWGKNDSVGVLTNLLPAGVALYNLIVDIRVKRSDANA
ncbi:MAG TPA: lipid-A-disaccharide synthase N-terminal domain-containing protein [Steroidobacteraceae bacterium]|nr:lipid-A-disaccharide synthase N-terminal domain-containing protein [Steroidobacteraceae bacterium]